MTAKWPLAWWLLAALCGASSVEARVIRVGPGGEISRISEAAKIARDGDVVEIAAGEWRADVALWSQKHLTIRGAGARPVLIADGQSTEGKAIWVIRNGDFRVENIEFRGARVPDGNGAGIRFEGGRLLVLNCAFYDNQMGILASNNDRAELTIENSVFANAPQQSEPLPHLLYAGRIALLKVTGSRFHSGHVGHLIKSRARETELRYNLIDDGPNGSASYEVDLPNGGVATLIGNVIGQSEKTANPVVVAFGAEGKHWEKNRLYVVNNTLVSAGTRPAWFIRAWRHELPRDFRAHIANNLWSGVGFFDYGLPGTSSANLLVWPQVFDGREVFDYRLTPGSWFKGLADPLQVDGQDLTPTSEFAFPVGTRPRSDVGRLMPGAYQ